MVGRASPRAVPKVRKALRPPPVGPVAVRKDSPQAIPKLRKVGLVAVRKDSSRAVPQVKATLHLFQRVMLVALRKDHAAMLGVVGPELCAG